MASLKDLRNRINSVKSTQKITKAMQMVAASKLRRAQEAVEASRPYAEKMKSVIASLAGGIPEGGTAPLLLTGTGAEGKALVVVATAERGLCGGFNTSIVRGARKKIAQLKEAGKQVRILCIGKKGLAQLKRDFTQDIIDTIDLSEVKRITFADAQPIAERLLQMFDAGAFDHCYLFFAKFKSVISQVVTEQQLIPVQVPEAEEATGDTGAMEAEAIYDYEPEEGAILEALLPRSVSVQILQALLENAASEQGARMSAMDSATRNAGDLIDKLTLNYNRTRQAVITTELTEIISGAEAL